VAISDFRKRKRRQNLPIDDRIEQLAATPNSDPELVEQIQRLYRVIDGLDPLNRALMLLYLENHSYREMAEILGISETNVATKISRLKSQMKNQMNPGVTRGGV
jgi:RNA polymerase sigma-70 factor (ECF subfamily)